MTLEGLFEKQATRDHEQCGQLSEIRYRMAIEDGNGAGRDHDGHPSQHGHR